MNLFVPPTEPQLIDRRVSFYRCGVDYGSDAKVILVKGFSRLVWAKTTKTLTGIRGCGFVQTPCCLELREFRLDAENNLLPKKSEMLLVGGRLSKERLLSIADKIDAVFGDGVAANLNYRKTKVIDEDKVSTWLEEQRKREEESAKQRSLMWKENTKNLPDMTSFGEKI